MYMVLKIHMYKYITNIHQNVKWNSCVHNSAKKVKETIWIIYKHIYADTTAGKYNMKNKRKNVPQFIYVCTTKKTNFFFKQIK